MPEVDLQPLRRRQTPRTSDEAHSHQCAMRGRWDVVVSKGSKSGVEAQSRKGELTQ
jgi:hypothetical protein